MPFVLRYSPGKLVLWIMLGAVMGAGGVWMLTSGASDPADYHGRGAGIAHMLGPQGTQLLFIVFVAGCAIVAIGYLRLLLLSDRTAAIADREAVVLDGLWGKKHFAWRDIRGIGLHGIFAAGRERRFIKIEFEGRRDYMMPLNGIEGGLAAVEAWLADISTLPNGVPTD